MKNYQNINKGRTIDIEDIVTELGSLGRGELYKRIKNFKCGFTLDFTDDYLSKRSEGELRHILLAAYANTISK